MCSMQQHALCVATAFLGSRGTAFTIRYLMLGFEALAIDTLLACGIVANLHGSVFSPVRGPVPM
jgi:hypothetical protein